MKNIDELKKHAINMRILALDMSYNSGGRSHLGGGLSAIEPLAVLYGDVMNAANSKLSFEEKDKFILSKGHGVLCLYTALAEFGVIDKALLDTFLKDESDLIAHPVMNSKLGIDASTGSLGQGISIAVGLALLAKKKNYSYQTYTLCGNGECNEGSVWEACMFAVSNKLNNFTLYIDNNNMQSDGDSTRVLNVSDKYCNMLDSLGFQTIVVNGNNIEELHSAFHIKHEDAPKAIIGNSIKGCGVSFMENNNDWHHNRLTKEQYEKAIEELRSKT